jgi:hypothetical protein
VKPTRSQKRTVTILRSSCTDAAGCPVRGAAQKGQKGNSPGSSLPHVEHVVTNRVYVRELAKEGANAEALFRTRTGDPLLTMEVATLPLRSFLRPDG